MSYPTRPDARVVVGLDFGTTFSGFAYAYESNPDVVCVHHEWPGFTEASGKPYCKTQTALYYKPSRNGLQYDSWGWQAQLNYTRDLDLVQRKKAAANTVGELITRFKLHLADKDAGPLSAAPLPRTLTTKQVITDFLREIGKFIMAHLNLKYGSHLTMEELQWCVTVPSIWGDRAKQQMKEFMQGAGLVGGSKGSPYPVMVLQDPEAAAVLSLKEEEVDARLIPPRKKPIHACDKPVLLWRFQGVRTRKGTRGFLVEIRPPKWKRKIWLGTYSTEREAAGAYDAGLFYTKRKITSYNFSGLQKHLLPLPSHLRFDHAEDQQEIKEFVQKQARLAASIAKLYYGENFTDERQDSNSSSGIQNVDTKNGSPSETLGASPCRETNGTERKSIDEDDLIAKLAPFIKQQIEDALTSTVLPLVSVLRIREENEQKHREKLLALENVKLALKSEKLLFEQRRVGLSQPAPPKPRATRQD